MIGKWIFVACIPAGVGLAFLIFYFVWRTENKDLFKIQKQRKQWQNEYPIGTKIEVVTWEYETQADANKYLEHVEWLRAGKQPKAEFLKIKSKRIRNSKYYTIVSPQEYFSRQLGHWEKYEWDWYMNEHGILLFCKEDDIVGEVRTFTTENLLEIAQGKKEIHKVSDVKLKILELKGR